MDTYNASITPAAKPPPGITPNFINPPSEKNVIVAYTTVFTIIATLGVAIRMYVRYFIMKKLQIEDYLLASSWIFFMVFNGFVYTAALDSVMGRHAWDVNLIQLEYFLWLLNTATIIYGPMLICGKGALILLWERIFAETASRAALRWFLRVLFYINVAVYICGMALQTFTCTPRAKIWQPWLDGYCIDAEASFLFTASWNLFLDISLLIIPLFSARNLRLQRKRKWILMGCFALGIITCAASLLRIVNAVQLASSTDQIYDEQNSIWSAALEQTGVTLVICSPTFHKFYRHFRGEEDQTDPDSEDPQQSSEKQAISPGFASSRPWVVSGNGKLSLTSTVGSGQQDTELTDEKELCYHAIRRIESINRPTKVHIRNDVTISIAETGSITSVAPYSAYRHPETRSRNESTSA